VCRPHANRPSKKFSEDDGYLALGLLQEGYSSQYVAHDIECVLTSLRRCQQHCANAGSNCANSTYRNTHQDRAVFNGDLAHAILSLVQSEPAAFLKKYTHLLNALETNDSELAGLSASPSTVHHILRFQGDTRKTM